MIASYTLEFILHARGSSATIIKNSLAEFGEELKVSREPAESPDFKVSMVTQEPVLVFDLCAQLGRIRSIKVHETVV